MKNYFDNDEVFIIGEIGSNHKQDLNLAKEHIYAVKEAGANAVKFQSLNVNELYFNPTQEIQDLHKKIDFQESWHFELKSLCDRLGIVFFSSPTYLKAIDIMEEAGVEIYKLASAQVGTFPQLLHKVAKTQKPTLISTGLVNYKDLADAVNIFINVRNKNFAILHCNSIYPTPPHKVNLQRIKTYHEMFGCPVGFSDHTIGIHIPVAAVAYGAKIIEKHFRLSKEISTPDSAVSLDFVELRAMVREIRDVETVLKTDKRYEIEKEETTFKDKIRYKLVLKNKKSENQNFDLFDFDYLRDNKGIDVSMEKEIIENMCASKNLDNRTLITWDMLKGKTKNND